MTKPTVDTAAVRAFYRADAKRIARLSPEAQKTVTEGARGRLHPEAIKDHNSRRKVQYVLGTTSAAAKAKVEARAELVSKGLAGKRGPLSKATKEILAQPKG